MGRKARSSPWNAGSPRQSPARPRPLMSAATRRSLGGDGPRPAPPLGSPGTTGWPADGSGKWVSWIRRPVPFGQPSRGKACDLSPTHSLDRPPAANPDAGATDPCATQRRVRLGPQFSGDGTWPVDGTGAGPDIVCCVAPHFATPLQGFGRPCCSAANARGSPKMRGAPGWHPQGGRAGRRWPKSSRG